MIISDLMMRGATPVDPSRTVPDADIGALPVGENDRLFGVVTDRDIVARGVASDLEPTVATHLPKGELEHVTHMLPSDVQTLFSDR